MKYKYIVYCMLTPEGQKLSMDQWRKYFAKEDEIAKKHEIKVLFRGTVYGVIESYVSVYETEKPIDALSQVYQEAGRSQYVSAARTNTVVSLE
ncbi:MAG: hypothetical protein NWF14_01650 [Candidatus Bathyarchaeota archaeon]|nr:hypothetical protein [Candidatus Bathyarchaeota archaeon]